MSRFTRWLHEIAPTRDSFERNRFLRPFAHRVFHPALWRFTRRSVPRGVALGLLVGIFLLIPGVQIAGVALLALPIRANIPLGAAMTFLSNPLTTFGIILGAGYVGGVDTTPLQAIMNSSMPWWPKFLQLTEWALSDAAPAAIWGLFVISVVSAAIGYVISAAFWRWRISTKWRRRSKPVDAAA